MTHETVSTPAAPIAQTAPLDADELVEALYRDLRRALGLRPESWGARVLLGGLRPAARSFARYAITFDQIVAERGFAEAAAWASSLIFRQIRTEGSEQVPREGPLLVTSNHPGTADSLAIAAALGRPDLKIIASNMPIIRSLPSASKHIIFAAYGDLPHERMTVVREAVRHLKEDGALLIFPSGRVDPDPSVLPHPETTFDFWSSSLGLLLRSVPETQVQVSIASGVLSPMSLRNPFTWFQKGTMERQRAAEIFQTVQQILLPRSVNLTANITLGSPFTLGGSGERQSAKELTQEVIDKARATLREHVQEWFGSSD